MLTLRKYSVCRLCLCSSDRLKNIFEDDCGVEFSLPEALKDLLQIEVNSISGLPWQICSCCLDKLAEFRLFKRRCLECKVTFESRLQNAIHLLSGSGLTLGQPPVVAIKKENGEIQKGHLLQLRHGESLVTECMDVSSTNIMSAVNSLKAVHIKKENLSDNESKEKRRECVMIGENVEAHGDKNKSVRNIALDGNAHSSRTDKVDVSRVKLEPVEQTSSEKSEQPQNFSEKRDKGTVFLRPNHDASTHLPLPQQLSANLKMEPEVESSPPTRLCRRSSWSSVGVKRLPSEYDLDCSSDSGDDSDSYDETYVPEEESHPYTLVPFHKKKEVVAKALAHPGWKMPTLMRLTTALKSRTQLNKWIKEVQAGQQQLTKRCGSSKKIPKSKSKKKSRGEKSKHAL